MFRELITQYGQVKKALNESLANLKNKQLKMKEDLLRIEEELAETQTKLDRAYLYSQRFGDRQIPVCLSCFVDHDWEYQMKESTSSPSHARLFECPRCDRKLSVAIN